MDIGTPERYLQASWDILEGRVQTATAARLDGTGLLVEDGAQVIAARASIRLPCWRPGSGWGQGRRSAPGP